MNKRLLGKLHRWIFIYMGAFMLMWAITGIVIALPYYWFTGEIHDKQPSIDYNTYTLSPADAISRFRQHHGSGLNVNHVELAQIDDSLYYHMRADGGIKGNIDARTGELFSVSAALAEKYARSKFGIDAPLLESAYLTEYSAIYPNGKLPIYRLTFEDNPDNYYYVSPDKGHVNRSTLTTRIRNGIVSLHGFDPVQSLTGSEKLKRGSLVLTGAITLVGTVIGVILIFPLRRKIARKKVQ